MIRYNQSIFKLRPKQINKNQQNNTDIEINIPPKNNKHITQ